MPTIQYHTFTDHWLKAHPEGSIFLTLGLLWVQDQVELEEAILSILSNNYKIPNLSERIQHYETLDPILDFINVEPLQC